MNLARPRSPSRVISCSPATSACLRPFCVKGISRQRLPRWLQCDGSGNGSGYQSDCTDGSLETPPICAKAVS